MIGRLEELPEQDFEKGQQIQEEVLSDECDVDPSSSSLSKIWADLSGLAIQVLAACLSGRILRILMQS